MALSLGTMTIDTAIPAGGQEALWVEQAHLQARQSLHSTLPSSLRGRLTTSKKKAVSPSVVLLQKRTMAAAGERTINHDSDAINLDNHPPPDHLFVRVLAARKLLSEGKTTAAFEQALAVRQAMESTSVLLDVGSMPHDATEASAALTHVLHDAVTKGHAAMDHGQYERAQDLLDFILPPATTVVQQQPDYPAMHSDGVSSLGFEDDETTTMTRMRFPPFPLRSQSRQQPKQRTTDDPREQIDDREKKNHGEKDNYAGNMDKNGPEAMEVMSMSSLNEILDGPLSPSPKPQRGRFSLLRFSKRTGLSELDIDHHHRTAVSTALHAAVEKPKEEPCRFMATIVVGEEQQTATCWNTSVEVSVAGLALTEKQEDTDQHDDGDHNEEGDIQLAPCVTVEEEADRGSERWEDVSVEEEEDEVHVTDTLASVSEDCSLPSTTSSSVSCSSSRVDTTMNTKEAAEAQEVKRDFCATRPSAKRKSPLRRMFLRRRRKEQSELEQQHDHEIALKLEDLLDEELLSSVAEGASNTSKKVPVSPSSVPADQGDRYAVDQVHKQEQLHSSKANEDDRDDKYSIPTDLQQLTCPSPVFGCNDSCMWRGTPAATAVTLGDEDAYDIDEQTNQASTAAAMLYSPTVRNTDKYGDAGTGVDDENDIAGPTKELEDGNNVVGDSRPALHLQSTKRFALTHRQLPVKARSKLITAKIEESLSPPQHRLPLRGILKSSSSVKLCNEIHTFPIDQQQHDTIVVEQYETSPPLTDNKAWRPSSHSHRSDGDENTHYKDPLLDRLCRRGLEPREPQAPRLDP